MHSLSYCLWRYFALHVNTPPPPYAHHNAKPITHSQHTHTHPHSSNDSGMRKQLALAFQKSTNLSLRLSSLPISLCLLHPSPAKLAQMLPPVPQSALHYFPQTHYFT